MHENGQIAMHRGEGSGKSFIMSPVAISFFCNYGVIMKSTVKS